MATYHQNATTGTRAGGQSAAAKSDYILREGRYAGDSAEVLYAESGHMPAWAADNPRDYWVATDQFERANARLYKELRFALPYENTLQECIGVAHRMVDEARFEVLPPDTEGPRARVDLPYTLAIHRGADRNLHAHVLLSERQNDGIERTPKTWFKRYNAKDPEAGGARKTRILKPTRWLMHMREYQAECINAILPEGVARVDHRSYEDRGIDRIPQIHLGAYAHRLLQGQTVNAKDMPDYTRVARYRYIETLQLHRESLISDWPLVDKEDVRKSRAALAAEARTELNPTRTLKILDHHEALTGYLSGKFRLQEAYDRLEADERALAERREAEADRVRPPIERDQRPRYQPPPDQGGEKYKYG